MASMDPGQFLAFLGQGFVGQIPVWDQSMQHEVGYRQNYGSGDVVLYSGYTATPGAILYSPDVLGNLITLTVGSSSPAGHATTSLLSSTGMTTPTILNQLPGWAMGAAVGVAAFLLLSLAGGGGRRYR